ncbi:hypothetical protein SNE40_018831 [Patella caerulea]|uniref:Alpha-taxilin n=1 Tax=Patella caerulea TaxID=87958 RepID=A0AAN8J957_PATCE
MSLLDAVRKIGGVFWKASESESEDLTVCKYKNDSNEICKLIESTTSSSVDQQQVHINELEEQSLLENQLEKPLTLELPTLTIIDPPYLVDNTTIEESTISMATEAETLIPVQELPVSQEVAILDNSLDIKETEAPLSLPETTNIEDIINDLSGDSEEQDNKMAPTIDNGLAVNENDKSAQKTDENQKVKSGSVLKSKRKEDKGIDHILRALSSLDTTEEKLAALCKKYADIHEEHRVLQVSFKQAQRRMAVISREKDQIQSEHTKAVMGKSKLESLCRELQKHNKIIKEESIQRAKEEDEKRKEISAKFQTTIGEIQQQMQDNHDRNSKLREENADLAGKLKGFIEKYEIREEQLEKLMKHREVEQQLADAKLQQANLILKQEQERGSKEKELLLTQNDESVKKASILEAQLTMYKDRYEEFQTTINKSNEMFQKFKSEMDKMGKRIKKLEKEGASWKAKWQGCNKALLDMVDEKQKNDQERTKLQTKNNKLESLCRALQNELHGKKGSEVKEIVENSTPLNTQEESSSPSVDSTETTPVIQKLVNGTNADETPSSSDTTNTEESSNSHIHAASEEGEVTSTTEVISQPEEKPADDDLDSAVNAMNEVD